MSKKRGRGAMTVRGRGSYVGDVRRRSDWVVAARSLMLPGLRSLDQLMGRFRAIP